MENPHALAAMERLAIHPVNRSNYRRLKQATY
jgi:hypothetical protein